MSALEDKERVTSIPLREWTARAVETVDISALGDESFTSSFGGDSSSWPAKIRKSLTVTSDSYLSSALKVAQSLADQICQAEEEGGRQRSFPTPGPDWADWIVVHVSNEHQRSVVNEVDVPSLPFSRQDSSSDPIDLQAMLNSLIPDESLFTQGDAEVERVCSGDSGRNIVSYHNVVGSEILPFPSVGNGCLNDKMVHVHSLGIVFYELFSGGERYPDIILHGNSKPKTENGCGNAPHGSGCTFDLEGRLNMLDRMSDVLGSLDDDELDSNVEQMPSRKKAPQADGTVHSESVGKLQLLGLPVSLCNLIGNMIDCIRGDLRGKEAYSNMSDVRSDLQLMLENPNIFLHDMDVDKLAITGLQLNESVFTRDADFCSLKDSYMRSISGENEIGIIVGPSGVGKSIFAHRLGSFVTSVGGLFLSGKFDQVQHQPFSALASAFNDYCNKISKEGRRLQEVASQLKAALGNDAYHLAKVIPNLSIILCDDAAQQDDDQDCVDAQKRLQYLLCRFVDIISSYSGSPVILFLDDLQWADEASISAINQILMVNGSMNSKQQFFFLGSSREEGLLEDHPFGNILSNLRHLGVRATVVELNCMDKEMTNRMMSELLCLPPRLTRTLTEIVHHRTKGNPLFFTQLMISLHKDGLLWLSLSHRRWEWDEDKIRSRKLPDDVAKFLMSTIGRLPKEVQNVLCILSCFGAFSSDQVFEVLEKHFGTPLIELLDFAVAEGLVDRSNGGYSFGHDRLQEAAYNMIKLEDRCLYHFNYGVALVPRALELQNDDDCGMLFTAATQINRGGPAALQDVEQAILIANLNLTAGQKAIEMSDFPSAFSFFDNGISFLRKRHWHDYYDLSLSLFEAAAQCALVIGDIISVKLLSEQVLAHAKSFKDTLKVIFITVTALAYASQLPESINRSILALSELGEELPESYSETEIKFCIEQTKVMLQGFSDEELLGYKIMDDPSKIMAMNFYARLETSFQMTKQMAQPVVTMKIVQLSIAQGMSPVSLIGFAYFGQLLASLGEVKEATRYVKIATELLGRSGSKEVAGEVISVGTQVLCLVEPLQTTLEFHVQGETAAMKSGDIHAAILNRILHLATSFWAGAKLSTWKKEYDRAHRLCQEYKHATFLAHIIQMEKYLSLMGAEGDADRATNPNQTQKQAVQEVIDVQEANPHAQYTAILQNMYISFMLRKFDQTKELAEKYFAFNLHTWAILYIHTTHAFYGGLVSFWIYRQSNDPIWVTRGQKAKDAMTKWVDSSEWNFLHKAHLLEAEEAFCNNSFERAKLFYEKAVSVAKQHRFINEEALACELAGYFFLEMEKNDTAIQYFMQAHKKYHEWGAVAKSNALFEFVQKVLSPSSRSMAGSISNSFSSASDAQWGSNDENRRKRGAKRTGH